MKNDFFIKNIGDFVGNKNKILNIVKIIKDESKCILIKGLPMSGKTTLIKLILDDLNIEYKYILANTLPNKKNIQNFINNYFSSYDIKDLITNVKTTKIIVIDNLETLNNNHKYCLIELSKIYIKYNKLIIFITNKNHFKFSKIVNEMCESITIDNPTNQELNNYILNINPDLSPDNITMLIKKSNNNIKILNDFLMKKNCINNSIQTNSTLFNIVFELLNNYISLETVISYYNHDKYLLPLLFHENYLNFLNKSNISRTNENIILLNILKSLIYYDQLDNYMYAYQYWDLQDICGLISCSIGSYYITKYINTNSTFLLKDIVFTSYLNKVSLISINRKTIQKLCDKFNVNSIYKLLRIRYLLEFTNSSDLIKRYNLSSKELLTLVKIDKTKV